ncbi:methylated-DNA--[protein]-cysteine S-methyltransferase [Pectinatus haikarae]|uniref:Methylated-DNA--protein-cysteine methyltransferase n=1 Tax=Pectinatus haikarae TaxID=349096 RepID=A0ABT9Y6F3_9FIRM|nr:methylated-DNA--[protein]-cysteine S-methyltransferase [Pectinatus haikarae]MDQ0203218.1 methylated-DNA-[protein]-cysteine S-methyltransferase [Pectinatus haikarae]
MKYTYFIETELGTIGISETDGSITELFLTKNRQKTTGGSQTPMLKEAEKQITEYLSGQRREFDLPLAAEGTAFQKSVWAALRKIPYGETRSYKQIAEMIGNPNASRAVGMANNKNPLLIVTPCHRVIGADGKLVGYAAGLAIKERLLKLERANKEEKTDAR